MSTLKSSAEDLTLNADGSGNDVIIQSDGSTKVIIDGTTGNVGIGDTDPSEAKLSIDNVAAGDAGLKIVQAQAAYGLDIDMNANHYAFHIDTTSTTNPAIEVEANALTTGKAGYFYSNSADTSTRQLLRVTNDHASSTGTTNLYVDNDSTGLVADFHGAGGIRSASGIKFGTDTAAANTLEDYEEGTWTPTGDGGIASSITATDCYYTKIGRIVHVQGHMSGFTGHTGTTLKIEGLPYSVTHASNSALINGIKINTQDDIWALWCYLTHLGTSMYFRNSYDDAMYSSLVGTDLDQSGCSILINATYIHE